jgi:hypothetical protein
VLRSLHRILITLRIPTFVRGLGRENCGGTPVHNAKFASFMSVQGCGRRRHPDRHDRRLRRQKFTRTFAFLCAVLGSAWVALESAKAFSLF